MRDGASFEWSNGVGNAIAAALLLPLAASAQGPPACTGTQVTLGFTGAAQQFVVPAGVTSLTIDAAGAQGGGGGRGGMGARLVAAFPTTPGETLHVVVGGSGLGSFSFGGGGGSFVYRSADASGLLLAAAGGGGAASISNGDSGRATLAADDGQSNGGGGGGLAGTAGGGGGAGFDKSQLGGGGGGGGLLTDGGSSFGHGGKALANGALGGLHGALGGDGGFGGGGGGAGLGAGGGGGYNGGGGGGGGDQANPADAGGGGGGSAVNVGGSLVDPTGVGNSLFAQTGAQSGDGQVSFCYVLPDLTVQKSHAGIWRHGDVGRTYTLTVSNVGDGPTNGSVTVTDSLPAGLTATGFSGTGWTSCTSTPVVGPGVLSCQRSDTLANGASYPAITLTVDVALDAPSTLTNSAAVAGGGEVETANDTASDPATIGAAPITSVPTLSESGLLLFCGALVMLGLRSLRRGEAR